MSNNKKALRQVYDDRRDLIVRGNGDQTLVFCVEHFIETANKAIEDHAYFAVALSGGGTPKAIFQKLTDVENCSRIDWNRVLLFWSDERCVPKDHPDSNYRMAMDAGFSKLAISKENIFPMEMEGEGSVELKRCAQKYQELICRKIRLKIFDLVMLGIGEDGHTASLFPHTEALSSHEQLVLANFVLQKNTWRMTLSFDCINSARCIVLYALGKSKKEIVKKVLVSAYDPDSLPAQRIGTSSNKALWIMDDAAAAAL